MYTGKISLTQSNAVDIVKVSDLFELMAVKNTTLKFIEDYISFEVRYNSLIFATDSLSPIYKDDEKVK